jgi:hypothetical protein
LKRQRSRHGDASGHRCIASSAVQAVIKRGPSRSSCSMLVKFLVLHSTVMPRGKELFPIREKPVTGTGRHYQWKAGEDNAGVGRGNGKRSPPLANAARGEDSSLKEITNLWDHQQIGLQMSVLVQSGTGPYRCSVRAMGNRTLPGGDARVVSEEVSGAGRD